MINYPKLNGSNRIVVLFTSIYH